MSHPSICSTVQQLELKTQMVLEACGIAPKWIGKSVHPGAVRTYESKTHLS